MRANDLKFSLFETELDNRVEHMKGYIQAVQAGKYAPMICALWNLRTLQDESRSAGCEELCRVSRQMETHLLLGAGRVSEELLLLMAELSKASARAKQDMRDTRGCVETPLVNQATLCATGDTA